MNKENKEIIKQLRAINQSIINHYIHVMSLYLILNRLLKRLQNTNLPSIQGLLELVAKAQEKNDEQWNEFFEYIKISEKKLKKIRSQEAENKT